MSSANEKLVDAAGRDDVAEIERQLAAGANPNAFEGTNEWTPLQRAAISGHIAAMAALVKAGARVDGASSDGATPLILVASQSSLAAIDALLAAGADVHRADKHGDTALHWASMYGRLDAARVLLEAGARTDVRNEDGERPVDVVCAPSRSLGAAVRPRHTTAPPRSRAQVGAWTDDVSNAAAMRALLGRPPAVKLRAPASSAGGADARSHVVATPAAAGGWLGCLPFFA
jgi:hypothetical protein